MDRTAGPAAGGGIPGARPRHARRTAYRALLLLGCFVLPLVLLEVGVRILVSTHRLPIAAAHSEDFEVSWVNLERAGRVDVLVLGNSMFQHGIEPVVLRDLLESTMGRSFSIFNAATPGAGYSVNRAIVQQLIRTDRLPRVAIVGIWANRIVNDRTFREFFGRTEMGMLFTECELASDLPTWFDCQASAVSAAWRWRGRLDRLAGALDHPVPRVWRLGTVVQRADGFRATRGSTEERLRTQLERIREGSADYAMEAGMPASYARLVSLLRDHGVTVIPVAMPLNPMRAEMLEELFPGYLERYRAGVDRLSAAADVDAVWLGEFGSWWRPAAARDILHLSADGAVDFTQQLWAAAEFRERLIAGLTGS